jgi:K+-transporting ATPase KdpF subunit
MTNAISHIILQLFYLVLSTIFIYIISSFGDHHFMDFIIAGLICAGLLGYLVYALFNPEKF